MESPVSELDIHLFNCFKNDDMASAARNETIGNESPNRPHSLMSPESLMTNAFRTPKNGFRSVVSADPPLRKRKREKFEKEPFSFSEALKQAKKHRVFSPPKVDHPSSALVPPMVVSSPLQTDTIEDRREKQFLLAKLQKLQKDGVQLSKSFSLDDSLSDISFELECHEYFTSMVTTREKWKGFIITAAVMIEMANTQWGPFLKLAGWSQDLSDNSKIFDRPLEQCYKRYYRHTPQNPILELSFAFFGSMFMYGLPGLGGTLLGFASQIHNTTKAETPPSTDAARFEFRSTDTSAHKLRKEFTCPDSPLELVTPTPDTVVSVLPLD